MRPLAKLNSIRPYHAWLGIVALLVLHVLHVRRRRHHSHMIHMRITMHVHLVLHSLLILLLQLLLGLVALVLHMSYPFVFEDCHLASHLIFITNKLTI